ncbi:MAG: hypothetical protein ABS939_01865 [Psychrobacillus sp.]
MQSQNYFKIVLEDDQTEQILDMKTNVHIKHKEQDYLVGVLEDKLNFFLFEVNRELDSTEEEQLLSIVTNPVLISELLLKCPDDIQIRYQQEKGNTNIVLFPRESNK